MIKSKTYGQLREVSRVAGSEGIVMLENKNNCLPLKENESVSVFGRCQIDYYRSGTGSGGAVNVEYKVNILGGLKNKASININTHLEMKYRDFIKANPFDNGGGVWAGEPWFQKEMPLDKSTVEDARKNSETAIIVIGRTAGEDQDNAYEEGSYLLTKTELNMIELVSESFDKVILLLNVPNIIDLSWLDKFEISALLFVWQGGQEGGNSIADVLCGDSCPSGKLTDTIAYRISDYPSDINFHSPSKKNIYEEDIYLGYRYFETFKQDCVRYPFGFGLSYTDFKITLQDQTFYDDKMNVTVLVKNIGNYSGKEVVQLYYACPQGKLGKPLIELGAFAKTDLLAPNESKAITLELDHKIMSSFDDTGKTEFPSSYILEKGVYRFFVGNSIRQHVKLKPLNIKKTIVVEKLSRAMVPSEDFKRMYPNIKENQTVISYENVIAKPINMKKRIHENLPKELKIKGNCGITLQDVHQNRSTLDDFVSQLSIKDLATIVRGEGMGSYKVTPGSAAAFGGLTKTLYDYMIPIACATDGPSGIRMDTGQKATQLPIGTLLACTWNTELVESLYEMVGKEMVLNNVDTLLGPGMNIHRHPLNGRNFEYFSEDPIVTGKIASAMTRGIKRGGSSATAKHFALNDQEKDRNYIDAIVSERAIREIHLKPFEMVVKEGQLESIMTAYNPINGIWAASNYDLNTTILRNEWGFEGIVMTDWWARMNDPINGGESSQQYASYMIRSQNDLYMVVDNDGAASNHMNDDIETSIQNNSLKLSELQRSVKNILKFILNQPLIEKKLNSFFDNRYFKSKENLDVIDESLSINFNTMKDKQGYFIVSDKGQYQVSYQVSFDSNALAQSACNLYFNDQFALSIQTNGTEGRLVTEDSITMELEPGRYDIKLKFTKPGLEIKTISIHKKTPN